MWEGTEDELEELGKVFVEHYKQILTQKRFPYGNPNKKGLGNKYATGNYATLTFGDTIFGQGGVAGFVAYAATSTDTSTGVFRIAEINSSGVITDILVCSGGSCVPL